MSIAATSTFIPVGDSDARAIVNGTQILTAEDVVSFSLLPYPPANKSLCVISWLKGSQRADQLLTLNRIPELSEQEKQDLFLAFAFESPTLSLSPAWWNGLSRAKRDE